MLVGITGRESGLWAIYILLGINIGAFIAGVIVTGRLDFSGTDYVLLFAYFKLWTFQYGWYWQFITSIFTHLNILHISLNMFFLYILGVQTERLVGGEKLIYLYLLSGFGGNIMTTLIPLSIGGLGASGAIFGIFGYLTSYYGMLGGNIKNMVFYAFFIFLINSLIPGVDILAHLGGLLVGLIWGYMDAKVFIRGARVYRYI